MCLSGETDFVLNEEVWAICDEKQVYFDIIEKPQLLALLSEIGIVSFQTQQEKRVLILTVTKLLFC